MDSPLLDIVSKISKPDGVKPSCPVSRVSEAIETSTASVDARSRQFDNTTSITGFGNLFSDEIHENFPIFLSMESAKENHDWAPKQFQSEPAQPAQPPDLATSPRDEFTSHDWGQVLDVSVEESHRISIEWGQTPMVFGQYVTSSYTRDWKAIEPKPASGSIPVQSVGKRKRNPTVSEPLGPMTEVDHAEEDLRAEQTSEPAEGSCKKRKFAATEPKAFIEKMEAEEDDAAKSGNDGAEASDGDEADEESDDGTLHDDNESDTDFVLATKKRSHKKKTRLNTVLAPVVANGPAAAYMPPLATPQTTSAATVTPANARHGHMTVAKRCPGCLKGRVKCNPSHPGAVPFRHR